MTTQKRKTRHGFTLIELLIVIGLLGGLTALILPSLNATREDALGNICDYNQAGTVRVLKQFKQLTGYYPTDMHCGMQGNATDALAMAGLPDAQATHMGDAATACPSAVALTDYHVNSLVKAGIKSYCYGTGLNRVELTEIATPSGADTTNFVVSADGWLADDGNSMTFDGVSIADWEAAATAPDKKAGDIVVFWIAPTTDWDTQAIANNDWSGGNVEMGIDLEGQCPIPATSTDADGEVSFAYYMAYFKVYDDGSAARLVGTTCPECGIMNP